MWNRILRIPSTLNKSKDVILNLQERVKSWMTLGGDGQIRDSPHRPSILRGTVTFSPFSFFFFFFGSFFFFKKRETAENFSLSLAIRRRFIVCLSPIFPAQILHAILTLFSTSSFGLGSEPGPSLFFPIRVNSAAAIMPTGSVSRSQQQHKVFMASVSQTSLLLPTCPIRWEWRGTHCGCPSLASVAPPDSRRLAALQ